MDLIDVIYTHTCVFSHFGCVWLCDMDCSLLGSFVHGILQARILEWDIPIIMLDTSRVLDLALRLGRQTYTRVYCNTKNKNLVPQPKINKMPRGN